MPKVSVIIPAYNAERTIMDTIQSVLAQSFTNFELIVINDGSTDNTLDVLNTISDSRLKVFSYTNAGVSTARNRGIEVATGEYLSFIDADDLWTPNKLKSQLTALEQKPEADIAYSWTSFIDEEGVFLYHGHRDRFQGNVLKQLLLKNLMENGSNVLIRSKVIPIVGGFDPKPKIAPAADWDFYLRLAKNCEFVVVPQPQILYRLGSATLSSNVEKMEQSILYVLDKSFQDAPPEFQSLKHQSLCNTYRYCADLYLRQSRNRANVNVALSYLWIAFQLYPPIAIEGYFQRLVIRSIRKFIEFQNLPLE